MVRSSGRAPPPGVALFLRTATPRASDHRKHTTPPSSPWRRRARRLARGLTRLLRMVLVGVAAGFGAYVPPPLLLRHQDPTAQIDNPER